MLLKGTHFILKTHIGSNEGIEKIFHTSGTQKRAGLVILVSDEIDLVKNCEKKVGHYKGNELR